MPQPSNSLGTEVADLAVHLPSSSPPGLQLSVNYHMTRVCNYECSFCFHTAKARDALTL